MANRPRPIETITLDIHDFANALMSHFKADGVICANERQLWSDITRIARGMSYENHKDALRTYIDRLEEGDDISLYGQQKAAAANFVIARLDDYRTPGERIVNLDDHRTNSAG